MPRKNLDDYKSRSDFLGTSIKPHELRSLLEKHSSWALVDNGSKHVKFKYLPTGEVITIPYRPSGGDDVSILVKRIVANVMFPREK